MSFTTFYLRRTSRRLKSRVVRDVGFTLTELVITMLVLGVLASIAIPSFLGSRNNSYDKEAQASIEVVLRAARLLYQSQGDFSNGSSAQCGDSALLAADVQKLEPGIDVVASSVSSTNSRVVSVQAVQTWNSNAELLGCQGFYAVALSSSGSCWAARLIVEGKFLAASSVSPVAVAQQTNTSNSAVTTWTALAVNGTAFGVLKPQTSAADGNNTNNLASIKTYCKAKEQSTGSPTVDGLYIAPSQFYATWRDVAPGGTASNVSGAAAAAVIAAAAGTGTLWTARTGAADASWNDIAYGDGKFVAVGNNAVMTSTDGITWTSRTYPQIYYGLGGDTWTGVAYGNGIWVAVAFSNGVMTSPDGITWTTRVGRTYTWQKVIYANGLFVAISDFTDGGALSQVMTSPDGITWTGRTNPGAGNNRMKDIAYGNGLFVIVASGGDGETRVFTSPDAATWTGRSIDYYRAPDFYSVAYGNNLFVGFGDGMRYTSPDGITWTKYNNGSPVNYEGWTSVIYGKNMWVALASGGTQRVMTSPDAVTWTLGNSVNDTKWWIAVAYDGVKLVAVSNFYGTANVMTG